MTPAHRRPENVDALFAELRSTGSDAIRTALIERHLPLARSLANRYRYTPQPLEDLQQVASLALVKAVDGFDPARGFPFASYAVPTILGELKRHMRDAGWAVHLPRSTKERVLAVESAERALSARLGGAPTVAQLAAQAGMSTEEILDALTARVAHDAVPLDAPQSTAGEPARAFGESLATADRELDAVDDRLSLSTAMRELPEREQTILRLRFIDGLTQTQIAERVGLSQMHVSRLLRATLETLRAHLAAAAEE